MGMIEGVLNAMESFSSIHFATLHKTHGFDEIISIADHFS